MTGGNPNIVHEAEAQRQHIRIPLPVRVMIDGTSYIAADWSNGGVGIQAPEGEGFPSMLAVGSKCDAVIHFPFEGFGMTLPVRLEVTYASQEAGRAGCRFIDLDRQQHSVIQYFVTAYISGEIIRVHDILDVVSRNNFTRTRNVPEPDAGQIAGRRTAHRWRTAALALIALLLVGYIVISIYERAFIMRATSARVTAEMLTVDAPAGGKVYFYPITPDSVVEEGAPLLTIATAAGNVLSADSPCDCIVKRRLTDNNRLARKGEPLLELVRPDSSAYIEAYIPQRYAVKLAVGGEALLSLPGRGSYLRGRVTAIQAGKGLEGNSLVTIIPLDTLPVESVDDPVEVRFDILGLL